MCLLICSGLLIRALATLQSQDPGFRVDHLLTLRTALPVPKYTNSAPRVAFYNNVLAGIRNLPGVTAAGYTSFLPVVVQGAVWPVTLPGQDVQLDRAFHLASLRFITPGYLNAMAIPLLRGRNVSEADGPASLTVAVVSESFVHQYFPHGDPLGHRFSIGFAIRTIVGVVGNVRVRGLERTSEPQVYLPYRQQLDGDLIWYAPKDLAIRYSGSGVGLVPQIRRIIASADTQQPLSDIQTASEIMDGETASRTTQLWVLVSFAALAMVLAGVGLYGLLSFTVSSRSQEIGLRIAIGAGNWDILQMILGDSFRLAMLGSLLGVALGYVSGRSLESLLAGVHAGDLKTYLVASALVGCMTLAGSLWPALRAVHVDPITALKSE